MRNNLGPTVTAITKAGKARKTGQKSDSTRENRVVQAIASE
jgi:hypothetical protein